MTSSAEPEPAPSSRRTVDARAMIAPHTEVRAGGRVVAEASTQMMPDSAGGTLHIHIECAAGHQPPWARRLLVHDLLTRAEHAHIQRALMIVPLGDAEILDVLREHGAGITTRAAGSSCIIEVDIRTTPPPDAVPPAGPGSD